MITVEDIALASACNRGVRTANDAIEEYVNCIGNGCWGYAFDFEDKVIKVTSSITEAIYALQLQDKKVECVAQIYNVSLYDEGNALYFIIEQERIANHEECPDIDRLQDLLSMSELGMANEFDEIIDAIKDNYPNCILSENDKALLREATDIYDVLLYNGFYDVDLHAGNLGTASRDGERKLVCLDQMNINLEDVLCDEYLQNRDILSILERNLPKHVLLNLDFLQSSVVKTIKYIEELHEFSCDLKYVFDTEHAYMHLPDGDWGAGGCQAFAEIAFKELKAFLVAEGIDSFVANPEIGVIHNAATGNAEHYFVKVGPLALDSSGLHNCCDYISTFIENDALHLTEDTLWLRTITFDELRNRHNHVDTDQLYEALKDTGLLPIAEQVITHSHVTP